MHWCARWLILLVALGSGCSQQADPKGGVLVFGGTGQLGAEIVERLVARGEEVTVFVRPTSDRARLAGMAVEYSVGDMLNEADVASAFQGRRYRAVINAVRAPITDVAFYDLTSQYVVAQAAAAGVQQIIHHGAVGAGDNRAEFPDVPWERVPGLAARMDDHGAAERNFMASGISTVVIRNSRVWPDGTQSTGQASLSEDHSIMTPITREDLADFTLECLDNPARAGKVYHAVDSTLTWPPPGRE
jgi:uncharacterized protein YbjT (DUF2867 family)